jgi:hypothetical protein
LNRMSRHAHHFSCLTPRFTDAPEIYPAAVTDSLRSDNGTVN